MCVCLCACVGGRGLMVGVTSLIGWPGKDLLQRRREGGEGGRSYKDTWRRSFQVKKVQRSWNRSPPVSWRNNKEIRSTFAKIKPSPKPLPRSKLGKFPVSVLSQQPASSLVTASATLHHDVSPPDSAAWALSL